MQNYKKLFFIYLLAFTIVSGCFGQEQKADTYYFNPVYGNNNVTLTSEQSSSGFMDKKLAETIDKVNKKGGGVITLKNGDYRFKDGVDLKSNVHLRMEPNVNFYMDESGTIFNAQSTETGQPISNFSVIGLPDDNSSERFTVHFKYGNSKETKNKKNIFIRFGYTTNFKISNVTIIDGFTATSSIVLSADVSFIDPMGGSKKNSRSNLISKVYGVPSKGIIEKVRNENGAYGYGVVQMQSGNNIVYRDLSGTGGVTLRLESGLNVNQLFRPVGSDPIYVVDGIGLPLTIDQQPKIDQVFAHNISCENGHAAFTMSPHTVKQGSVFLSKLHTISCEAGGEVSKGFINNFKREEEAGLAISDFGIEKGSFSNTSTISDVIAEFGQFSQIKAKNFRYIPCDLRVDRGTFEANVGLSIENGLDFESRIGPSLFPFHYSAASVEIGDGGYRVNIDEASIIGQGFGSNVETISINKSFDDCDETSHFSTVIGKESKKK